MVNDILFCRECKKDLTMKYVHMYIYRSIHNSEEDKDYKNKSVFNEYSTETVLNTFNCCYMKLT